MSGTQESSNVLNDGSHLGMSSQQSHTELEMLRNNRSGDANCGSLCGADSQEIGVMHGQAQYAPSTTGDYDLDAESNHQTMLKLQQDLSNMALAAQSNDAISATGARFPGQTSTINHTYNLSQEISQHPDAPVDTADYSDAESDTTITGLEGNNASFTSDHEIPMCPSPPLGAIDRSSANQANSQVANTIDLENYRRRHYRFITQVYATTAESTGPRSKRTNNGFTLRLAGDLRNIGVEDLLRSAGTNGIMAAGRRNRKTRPRSRSLDDFLDSLAEESQQDRDAPDPVYPPITKITNNNFDVLPNIDFDILRPVEGTPDEIAEDITAAVLGRPEPHKFTLCQCDYHDRTHVFVHTYPDIDVFDWNNEDDITDLNLFRASIIAKTFNINLLQTQNKTMHHTPENEDMHDTSVDGDMYATLEDEDMYDTPEDEDMKDD